VDEDRPDLFTSWLDAKLTGLAAGLARETRRWAVTLHDGGPRTRARSPDTALTYLREVTRDDVLGHIAALHGYERRQAVFACGPCSPGERRPA
jgi:hypothetical protein